MSLPASASFSQRCWHWAHRLACLLGFVYLLAPVIVVIPLSVSSSTFLSYPLPGWSLRWYEQILQPYPWMLAMKNSLFVASTVALVSTVLGTLAAYGLTLANFRFKGLIIATFVSPMVVPVVISAVAMYLFLAQLHLVGTFSGLILAHTVLASPFVVIIVLATLQGFDQNLIRAGASLGARPLTVFFRITLPLILPGVVSGAIFAFTTSFDEIVVAMFIAAPTQLTLPRQLFTGLRDQMDPSIVAAATLLIAISVTLMALMELLQWRGERLRSRQVHD